MAFPTTPTSVDSNEPTIGLPFAPSPTTIDSNDLGNDPEPSWLYRLAATEVAAVDACKIGGLRVPGVDVHQRVDMRCLLAALKQQNLQDTLAQRSEHFLAVILQLRETITHLGDRLAYSHLVTKRMWDKPHLSYMFARNLGHRILMNGEVFVLQEVEVQDWRALIVLQSTHEILQFEIPWNRVSTWINTVLWEIRCGFGHLEGQIGLSCSEFCHVTKSEGTRGTLGSSVALESFKV